MLWQECHLIWPRQVRKLAESLEGMIVHLPLFTSPIAKCASANADAACKITRLRSSELLDILNERPLPTNRKFHTHECLVAHYKPAALHTCSSLAQERMALPSQHILHHDQPPVQPFVAREVDHRSARARLGIRRAENQT